MRYVMDVLSGLDAYREGGSGGATPADSASPGPAAPVASSPAKEKSPMALPRRSSVTETSDDDDDDDLFGGGEDGQNLLDISIDATALSSAVSTSQPKKAFGSGAKRRLSSSYSPTPDNSSAKGASSSSGPISKKPKTLSGQNFLDMIQSIVNLDERFKSSIGVLESIPKSFLDENSTDIDDLVGDELTEMYKRVCQTQRNVRRERRGMYSVAVQRRELEKEAKRYVGWLKNLAKVDDDDIEFCDKLEKKLDVISLCHGKDCLVLLKCV